MFKLSTFQLLALSLCAFQVQATPPTNDGCILDQTNVKNEKEVRIRLINAETRQDDGFLKVDFKEGQFKKYDYAKTWCVDLARPISSNTNYHVDTYSTGAYPGDYNPGAIDLPLNLPGINYLINYHPIGSTVSPPNCTGTNYPVTDTDFQLAVWTIVDSEENPELSITGEEQCVVDYLVAEAMANIDYVPNCHNRHEMIGIILIVDDEYEAIYHQVLVAEVKLTATKICECNNGGGGGGGGGGGAFGDPHIKAWTGERYDFHGVCDLVLMSNPEFDNGVGMDIHIRSKRTRMWSYISSAAIRIGKDILEVVGGKKENSFWINGVQNKAAADEVALSLESTLSGYPILFQRVSNSERHFKIDLGDGEEILFKTWNAFVSVSVKNAKTEDFGNTVGLMGSFETGEKLGRDKKTIMQDINSLGQEWQVLATEGKLFHEDEGPQQPAKCDIPSNSEMRRRLGVNTVTMKDAEIACASLGKEDKDSCIFDVMATNDVFTAGAY